MPHKQLLLRVALIVFAIAVTATSAAARSQNAATTISCGDVITTDTALVRNLVCAGDGLTVTNGALLDLHGQRIKGNGTGTGVTVSGTGTVVTNGTITGFNRGVFVNNAPNARVEDLVVKGNVGHGIHADNFPQRDGLVIQRNTVVGNGTGIEMRGYSIFLAQVLDNDVSGNTDNGITVAASDGIVVQANRANENGRYGIEVRDSVSKILDNRMNRNALDGLHAEETFGLDYVLGWVIGGNRAKYNGGHGLYFSPAGIPDAGGNAAKGNAVEPQCVNLVC